MNNPTAPTNDPHPSRKRWFVSAAILLALVLIGTGYFVLDYNTHSQAASGGAIRSESSEVAILPAEAVRSSITTAVIERRQLSATINSVGTLIIPESAERTIAARSRGRIDKLFVPSTGELVEKGKPLYTFFSPDLLNAENEYRIAFAGMMQTMSSDSLGEMHHDHEAIGTGLLVANQTKLQNFGLTDQQIIALQDAAEPANTTTILSPDRGTLMQKLVREGAYVDEGTALFSVADLSKLWAELEIAEGDVSHVRKGMPVNVAASAYPGEVFHGVVMLVYPIEDAASHRTRVRVLLDNAKGKLRPQMFVSASLSVDLGRSLAIPSSAIVTTGNDHHVWVRGANGAFTSRMVKLGALASDGYYEVTEGLEQGETIAVTGAFFIDSEHQFALGTNPMAGMNMSGGDQGSKNSGETTGIVRSINSSTKTITLDHGTIPGVMGAMTMGYPVQDSTMLTKVQTKDHVRFTLTRTNEGEYVITAITKE